MQIEIFSIMFGMLILFFVTVIAFILLLLILRNKKHTSTIGNMRIYWTFPMLAFQLSKKQRKEVTDEFLKCVKKDREKNNERTKKIWKEKNNQLSYVIKEIWEK